MRFFLSATSFSVLTSFYSFAFAEDLNTRLQVAPEDRLVYNMVMNKVHQDIGPTVAPMRFTVEDTTSHPVAKEKVCEKAKRDEKVGTLELRDEQSHLRKVSYVVCVGKGSDDSFVQERVEGSDSVIVEPNLQAVVETLPGGAQDDDCDASRVINQNVCLPDGFNTYAWKNPVVTNNSEGSSILNVLADPQKPACLIVEFKIQGAGYDTFMGKNINCRGSARLRYNVTLYGTTTSLQ